MKQARTETTERNYIQNLERLGLAADRADLLTAVLVFAFIEIRR